MTQILIADFGSQYTFLIAKRFRKLGFYCDIVQPTSIKYDEIQEKNTKLFVLSGGPQSVYSKGSETLYNKTISELGECIKDPYICVLGICFGMQYICKFLNGVVEKGEKGEYGKAKMTLQTSLGDDNGGSGEYNSLLLEELKLDGDVTVWMSHEDKVVRLPEGFETLGSTPDCEYTFIANEELNIYAMQFHPEVKNTYKGKNYLKSILAISGCYKDWNNHCKITECEQYIKDKLCTPDTENHNVVLGLSGGVDSTVVAFLLKRCLPNERFKCVLIDHGMMRINEVTEIKQMCRDAEIPLDVCEYKHVFIDRLRAETHPETKRKIIGHTFIDAFKDYISKDKSGSTWMLAQGTIYPDVVESAKGITGDSHVIKSHHNVGGLPEQLGLELVEPLRHLFKNEVREIGKQIGVPEKVLIRHPFPGPGIAIRILGEVNKQNISIVQKADKIFIDKLIEYGLYKRVSQAFAGLLAGKAVGVVGDQRRYGLIIGLRAVETKDFMTATAFKFTGKFSSLLEEVSTSIVNSIPQVARVMYDITDKPPGTIEYE